MIYGNLKTDNKDYIPPESGRRYKITQQSDGTYTIEDVTEYLQVGDSFGAGPLNVIGDVVNKLASDYTEEGVRMPYRWVDLSDVYRKAAVIPRSSLQIEESEGADRKTYTLKVPAFAEDVIALCKIDAILNCENNWNLLLGGKRNGATDFGGCVYAAINDGVLDISAEIGNRLPSAVVSLTLIVEYTKIQKEQTV